MKKAPRHHKSEGDSMKVEIIRACMVKGEAKQIGDVVEVDEFTAGTLMNMGRAVPAGDKPKTSDRSVGLESSETKPRKRGRPKKAEAVDDPAESAEEGEDDSAV